MGRERDRAGVPRCRQLLEARDAAQGVERRQLELEHHPVGRGGADRNERVEGVRIGRDLEALREGALHGGKRRGVVVDDEDARLAAEEYLGDRVPIAPEEVENVDAAEAQVPARCAEVSDLAALRPVVDRLQIHLAEAGHLGGREELAWQIVVGRHGRIETRGDVDVERGRDWRQAAEYTLPAGVKQQWLDDASYSCPVASPSSACITVRNVSS